MGLTLLFIVIFLALVFDYINGFHDAANSIATVVSTKVLSPTQAVIWAAFFNFVAFLIFKEHNVANTVAKAVDTSQINLVVILAGILAAIFWNLLTWWFGIPSSSSHTLIGGFAGAAIAHGGLTIVNLQVIGKVAAFIFLAPIIGMILAYTLTVIIIHICKYAIPSKAEWWFRKLQLVSSAAFSIGHGGNDAQKVMGIIAAAIVVYTSSAAADMSQVPTWLHINTHLVNGKKVFELPNWIPLACYSAIALGTMSGGWKIVKTMGSKITKVTPLEGVAAETAGAITLFMTEHFKIPVSTTHTITGSIIGVGLSKRVSAVRWGVTVNLLWAWILTIPVSAALAALIYFVISVFIK
ncbi:MAG: inorganic phosphate transporter [Sphingobacteriaceae bacterium]|jgi:PiT family inorganic phosphate transporter